MVFTVAFFLLKKKKQLPAYKVSIRENKLPSWTPQDQPQKTRLLPEPAPTRAGFFFWANRLLGKGGGETCLKARSPPFPTALLGGEGSNS